MQHKERGGTMAMDRWIDGGIESQSARQTKTDREIERERDG